MLKHTYLHSKTISLLVLGRFQGSRYTCSSQYPKARVYTSCRAISLGLFQPPHPHIHVSACCVFTCLEAPNEQTNNLVLYLSPFKPLPCTYMKFQINGFNGFDTSPEMARNDGYLVSPLYIIPAATLFFHFTKYPISIPPPSHRFLS